MAGLLALGAALPAAASGTDTTPALEPYQIVRSLELVQDRLAGGDHASQPMQRKLLEMIDSRFATKEGARFENELQPPRAACLRHVAAAIPIRSRPRWNTSARTIPTARSARSILFYVNGQPAEAQEAFASVDPMAATPDVGMYLALVKGSMLAETEPAQALALLDRARLLGPGTLVEEAALRRSLADRRNARRRGALLHDVRELRPHLSALTLCQPVRRRICGRRRPARRRRSTEAR